MVHSDSRKPRRGAACASFSPAYFTHGNVNRATFFTNAQNWQTIPRIIGPLRKLGVAAAAIIDLDVVCAKKAEWNKFYKVINVDQTTIDTLDKLRIEVRDSLNALPVDTHNPSYKKAGISPLNTTQKRKAKRLFKELRKYGIFVVDVGELEGWLSSLELNKSRGKGGWIVKAFERLGSSPSAQNYVPPRQNRCLGLYGLRWRLDERPRAARTT